MKHVYNYCVILTENNVLSSNAIKNRKCDKDRVSFPTKNVILIYLQTEKIFEYYNAFIFYLFKSQVLISSIT